MDTIPNKKIVTLTDVLGAVNAEEMMIAPQYPIRMSQSDCWDYRVPVDKAARRSEWFHVQPAAVHHQQAVLGLDAETRELDVRFTVSPD